MYNVDKANGQQKNARKTNEPAIFAENKIFLVFQLFTISKSQNLQRIPLINLLEIVRPITY